MTAGYQAVRIMGWDKAATHIVSDNDYDRLKNEVGIAYCCRDYLK